VISRFLNSMWDAGFWLLVLLVSVLGWMLGGYVVLSLFRLIFGH
jgi:hypothetical protein